MKASGLFPDFEGWAVGYGAFTCSINERPRITNYIKKQKEHHRQVTFNDELKSLLDENGIIYDENYIFT